MEIRARRLFFVALSVLGISVAAFAGGPTDSLEVVQSVPLETTLSIPGIRETQAVWLEMIASAQTSIDLEQFYVSNQAGESLEPVLQAIHDAAARGVHVRLLVDQSYYSQYPDSVNEIGATPGCEARKIDFSSYGGVQHAKYFVIDGHEAFVGSQNFDWRALSHIHEVGLRVSNSSISAGLESIFEKDWSAAGNVSSKFHALLSFFGSIFSDPTLVASPPVANPSGISDTLSSLTQMIGSAKHSVQVQVMEYTTRVYNQLKTWTVLDQALRQAAARGVHVQLMVDVSSMKSGSKDLKALAKVPGIQVTTIKIPPYSGGPIPYARLIHSKYMLIDGAQAWVGSENWSESYFLNTRNAGLITRDAGAVSDLSAIFDRVWNSAYGTRL